MLGAGCARDNPRFQQSADGMPAAGDSTSAGGSGTGGGTGSGTEPGIGSTVEPMESTEGSETSDGGEDADACLDVDAECEPLAGRCCTALKCTPLDTGAGFFDAPRCVPFDPAGGAVGESCTVQGNRDGCLGGALCVGGLGGLGVCTRLCDPLGAGCDGACVAVVGASNWGLCLPHCGSDRGCAPGWGCYPAGSQLACAPAGGLQLGDACEGLNECAPGLACVELAPSPLGCDAACCHQQCDPAAEDTCPEPTQCAPLEFNVDAGVCV